MKKLILVLAMLSLMGAFVFAESLPTTATVSPQGIVFQVNPLSLDFPAAIAGTTSSATSPITFNVSSGNVGVIFTTSSTSGDALFNLIEVRNSGTQDAFLSIIGKTVTIPCVVVNNVCTYPTTPSWDAQLPIPMGTPAGSKAGAILYTVTGQTPQ